MSFQTDKDALIAILKDKQCAATKDVYANLNAYSDIPKFLFKYVKAFDGDNVYLDSIATVFDDTELVNNGIYYNKTGLTVTNPKAIIKSTNMIVNINSAGIFPDLEIIGASTGITINISNNTTVDSLSIAGGSTVDIINIQPGSCINTLLIKSENSQNSTLTKVVGKCVKNMGITEDSTFGGFECDPSDGTACLDEVIGLTNNTATVDGFTVAWTNPLNSTGNEVRYRKVGDLPWLVPNAFGNATGTFGPGPTFTFHAMLGATSYEVRVRNSCMIPTAFSGGVITTGTTL
jgi:hypothetical protein